MRRWMRLVWPAFAWLLCLLGASPVPAQSIMERLITPGPLASAHAKLEARCDACHASFRKEAQNAQCLTCHKPVGADIAAASGFHGKFGPARGGACKSCHADHKGRGFALVRLDRAGFNHGLTNYPLTGGHARVPCAQCHAAGHRFRDAPQSCASCHAAKDPHRGQLGRECQACHTTGGWKQPLPFDHARTGFALGGAHRTLQCLSCHVGQRWKGLPGTCAGCHARDDVHKGGNGANCAQCHTVASWKSAGFDHAATGFALTGGHATVDCGDCHGANLANRHPARQCSGCHARADVHKGGNGIDCAQCHTTRIWKQISFDHARLTGFPLLGAHRDALCAACHQQPARLVKAPVACVACHARDDRHKGGNGPDCGRCHDQASWKLAHFDHDRMTSFALLGKHAQLRCEQCHVQPAGTVRLPVTCGGCHVRDDVHAGRLGQSCGDCHASDDWKRNIAFDHGLTKFPLLGKHAALACAACHADRGFAEKGSGCAACHADTHHAGTLGTPSSCGQCHNSAGWRGWTFDHDRKTRFPLTGAHQGLICSACHKRAGDPAKLGHQCLDCHQRDDVHRGGFGDDCERCHVTSGFRQIRLGAGQR